VTSCLILLAVLLHTDHVTEAHALPANVAKPVAKAVAIVKALLTRGKKRDGFRSRESSSIESSEESGSQKQAPLPIPPGSKEGVPAPLPPVPSSGAAPVEPVDGAAPNPVVDPGQVQEPPPDMK